MNKIITFVSLFGHKDGPNGPIESYEFDINKVTGSVSGRLSNEAPLIATRFPLMAVINAYTQRDAEKPQKIASSQ